MIDYFESEDFTRAVFTIEDGEVVEHILSDLCRDYADETTSPRGVEPRFHLRGTELWTRGVGGQNPDLVMACDSEEEAVHALYLSFRYDLISGDNNPIVYNTREEAENDLREWQEEQNG